MPTLTVHLFKDSFRPFLALLNEHGVAYQMAQQRMGVPMAGGQALEIIQAVGNAAFGPSLAAIVVAFINSRKSRKVTITTKAGTVIQAEGMTAKELERVLERAQSLIAFDSGKTSEPPDAES